MNSAVKTVKFYLLGAFSRVPFWNGSGTG